MTSLAFLTHLRVSSENAGRRGGKARFVELGYVALMQHICIFNLYVKGQVQQRGEIRIVSDQLILFTEKFL